MKFVRTLFLFILFISSAGCIKSVSTSGMPKLEKGQPTGTLYVSYLKRSLPSGTRSVLINNDEAFRMNMGQYTKIKLNPGEYKIRIECVRIAGFHGMDSPYNTAFRMDAGAERYFMIQWDTNCKRPKKDHIREVVDKDKQDLIKSYELVAFNQMFKTEEVKVATVKPPCCDLGGHYRFPKPYRGEVTIKQNGANVEMTGRDLRLNVQARIAAETGQPHTPGPQIKITATLSGKDLTGQWWYVNQPGTKKPFSALVKTYNPYTTKVKTIQVSGELSGVWNKDK